MSPPARAPSAGRRLLVESTVYTGGLFLLRAGNFLLIPIYTALLTREEYGAVSVITALVSIVTIVGITSQTHALLRLGADREGDDDALARLIGTQMSWVIGATTVVSLLCAAVWDHLGPLVGGVPLWPLGVAGLASGIGAASFQLILSWLQHSGQARAHTSLSVVRWLVLMGAALALLYGPEWRAGAILTATAISFAVGTLVGWRALPRGVRLGVLDRGILRESLAYGLPVLPHGLASVAFLAADRSVLAAYHGLASVGVYELAAKLSSVVFMLSMGMQKAWLPFFFREVRDHAAQGWSRVRVLSFFSLSAVACVAVGMGLLGPELVAIAGPPSYAEAADLVSLMSASNFLRNYYMVAVAVIMADVRSARGIALATLPAAGLNVALNLLWVPEHGAAGAAWGTAVAYGLSVLLAGILARRAFAVPFKYGRGAILFVLVCGVLWLGEGRVLWERVGLGIAFAGALAALDGRDLRDGWRSFRGGKGVADPDPRAVDSVASVD